MDLYDALGLTGAIAMSLVSIRSLPRVWRFTGTPLEEVPPWWRGDAVSWRGCVRVMPLAIVAFWFLTAAVLLGPLVPEQPKDGFGFIRPAWYSLPIAVVGVAVWPLAVLIYAINWPKILVPPALRSDRGALRGR